MPCPIGWNKIFLNYHESSKFVTERDCPTQYQTGVVQTNCLFHDDSCFDIKYFLNNGGLTTPLALSSSTAVILDLTLELGGWQWTYSFAGLGVYPSLSQAKCDFYSNLFGVNKLSIVVRHLCAAAGPSAGPSNQPLTTNDIAQPR